MCAAGGFALYAFAAGAIVPAAQFWPASAFDQEWFYHVTGIPIQLVRGVVACWIAFSIWAIWGQQLVTDLSSADYTRFQRRQFIWTLVTMAAILVAGWTLTELLGNIYMDNVQRDSRGDIDLLASRLTVETETVDGMARALAGSPSVLPLLAGGGLRDWQRGKAVLDLDVEAFGAAAGYILDRSGAPVVSSERPEHTGSSAVNFRSSLLFQTSIAGGAGHLFAFDPRNGARDYYASAPIRAEGGAIVGVAVLKKSLDRFGTDVMRLDRPYFFIDPEGVVVLTNRPNLLFHALWPLSADALAAVAQKFGVIPGGPMMGREVTDATWIDVDGERDFVRRRFVDHSRWSLVILKPTQEIYATRILGIVITLLMAITTLIYLFGKERWVHDTIQLGKRLKLQELARDLRFQATTDPLTGLCNRLKFDQALANEVSRSARYQIPLSLVFYDIDHFKQINDAHGHQTGDKVLIQVSKLVADNIRGTDLLARWGGEEFIIMFPACDGRTACHAAEKLRLAIAQAVFEGVGAVTCSFGVAQHVEGTNADTLVARADRALYRAKINGRNRVELASADPLASVA
jgi:diguanylate cyclase (GGDEF)-like protein